MENRPDVILFTSSPLSEPLKIVGRVYVKVWASSDRQDTDFVVKLTDVYPDGRSILFVDGIVKGRFRNTYLREEFLVPGQVYEFEIDLGYTAIVLAPGHRLRLAVSSSNFDRWDINPNTGEPYGDHELTRQLIATRFRGYVPPAEKPQYTAALPAKNVISMDRQRLTHVVLPVVVPGDTKR